MQRLSINAEKTETSRLIRAYKATGRNIDFVKPRLWHSCSYHNVDSVLVHGHDHVTKGKP